MTLNYILPAFYCLLVCLCYIFCTYWCPYIS